MGSLLSQIKGGWEKEEPSSSLGNTETPACVRSKAPSSEDFPCLGESESQQKPVPRAGVRGSPCQHALPAHLCLPAGNVCALRSKDVCWDPVVAQEHTRPEGRKEGMSYLKGNSLEKPDREKKKIRCKREREIQSEREWTEIASEYFSLRESHKNSRLGTWKLRVTHSSANLM